MWSRARARSAPASAARRPFDSGSWDAGAVRDLESSDPCDGVRAVLQTAAARYRDARRLQPSSPAVESIEIPPPVRIFADPARSFPGSYSLRYRQDQHSKNQLVA